VAAVQQALRERFAQWGLPHRLRVDNGAPWANWSDLPPALVLWWIGLGIAPIWNHPHCPRENPKVERCNGLIDQWGEPPRCPDYATWERRLIWLARVQREEYPAGGSLSRLAAHPELAQRPRPYQIDQEADQWQLARVLQYLAPGRWPRLVSKIGQIHLYGQPYRVGAKYARQQVWVELAPEPCEWVVRADDGQELRRHPASQLTAERICHLQVAHPRPPHRQRK
jgi:hypothetical protein